MKAAEHEQTQRAVERARTLARKAARTFKAARVAAGFETVARVAREVRRV
jgi:uncharacterized protein YoaH (UPF0181 family)